MIGIYRVNAETWNLPFPVLASVKVYDSGKRFSVVLTDNMNREKPPLRTTYYGPAIGFGDRDAARQVREWLSYGDAALDTIASLLATLWADRYCDEGIPDITRDEANETETAA